MVEEVLENQGRKRQSSSGRSQGPAGRPARTQSALQPAWPISQLLATTIDSLHVVQNDLTDIQARGQKVRRYDLGIADKDISYRQYSQKDMSAVAMVEGLVKDIARQVTQLKQRERERKVQDARLIQALGRRCYICCSVSHLVRQCPLRKSNQTAVAVSNTAPDRLVRINSCDQSTRICGSSVTTSSDAVYPPYSPVWEARTMSIPMGIDLGARPHCENP